MPIYKMNGKKDGKQQYRVRINYTDSSGKAKQIDRIAYGSAEAKNLEIELKNNLKNETYKCSKTIEELYNEYIKNKTHDVRETTLDKSKRILNGYILPYLKDVKITNLTIPVLQNWKTEISNQSLALRTKKNIFSEFRTLLNYAVRMEYIIKNPLTIIENFKDPYLIEHTSSLKYYTPEEFKKYINQALNHCNTITDWGYYVFFNIAFYTGMRKGEINALKWSDIEGNLIHVRRSIAQKLKGADRETAPKNKSSYRTLQIPSPLIKILEEHKLRQKQTKGFTDDYRVCGGINCLRDTSLANKNIQFATEAELPVIRIHDFRHSHASLLANNGINIQEIARRLGHSKIEITWNTYSHLYPKEEERAIEILNKIV